MTTPQKGSVKAVTRLSHTPSFLPIFRKLPKAPCTWCGCLTFNGHRSGEIHCAGCESEPVNEVSLTKGSAAVAAIVAAGYVRRWMLKLDSGYTPESETSRLASIYPEVVWTHDPKTEPSES